MGDQWRELRVSNDCLRDAEELRRRLGDEGYLFFRGLQDRDKLASLRDDITRVLHEAGWLRRESAPSDGIADVSRRCTEGDVEYLDTYFKVQRLESFHRIAHEPEIMDVVRRVLGAEPIPLPGKKARIWFPKFTEHTTPLHQDFVHYQGSTDTLTCWAPVGDCPIELGPLAVLPGSHTVRRVLPHHFALGAGGLVIDLAQETPRYPALAAGWLSTDFAMGDTLFFPALTVHKALPNTTEQRMRISLDNRYAAVGGRIAAHQLMPHLSEGRGFSWEDVYQGWKSDELKYYWTRVAFKEIRRYFGYSSRGFDEAVQLARAGDARALLSMRRAIKANPVSGEADRARAVLAQVGEAV
jgi:ectoine hydroxylase-related dioxygenase (phytanoyl-CoA dioxygenase family)